MKSIITFSKLTVLILFFAISVSTSSCKKASTNPKGDSHITFKLDGVAKDFAFSSGINPNEFLQYEVEGSESSDTTVNYLRLSLYNDGPIDLNKDYSTPSWLFQIDYIDDASVNYINPRDQISTIRITEVTTKRIVGTFSGFVKNGSDVKTITDGVFDVARAE